MKHYEESILINARLEEIFGFIDDHKKFSEHMMSSSWMMGGGRMEVSVDGGHGQKIGSHIRLSGKAFGMNVFLDEAITRYEPPYFKEWETIGETKLIVVGHYKMGIAIRPQNNSSFLKVFIDYYLPEKNQWLGKLFGAYYAKWCVGQMIKGSRDYFTKSQQ